MASQRIGAESDLIAGPDFPGSSAEVEISPVTQALFCSIVYSDFQLPGILCMIAVKIMCVVFVDELQKGLMF